MRTAAVLLLALLVLAGCGGGAARRDERGLQRQLTKLVTGPYRVGPGATAYVSGPRGTWVGAAGSADVRRGTAMAPDARLRLESVTKLWTSVVVLGLVRDGRIHLDDTVERWLPGVFPDGGRITVLELLNHTSGLVDDNDIAADFPHWLAQVHDPALRAQLLRVAAALREDPAAQYPAMLAIRMAAAIPLLAKPGTIFHYSNIGYTLAGVIAERAARAPLAELYRRYIIDPLDLESAAYAPGNRFPGPHPVGYRVERGGRLVSATHWGSGGVLAGGGVAANAEDEARFLVALMQGDVLPPRLLRALKTPSDVSAGSYALGTGVTVTCNGTTYTHNGGGLAWSSSSPSARTARRSRCCS